MADEVRGIRVSIPSHPRFLAPVRDLAAWSAEQAGFGCEDTEAITLAVTEGCTNVIRHCYGGKHNERIDVDISFSTRALTIRIDDYGTFVDPASIHSRDLDEVRPGGLGVHLMQQVMDQVRYERNAWGGTSLTLMKHIQGDDHPLRSGELDG